MKKVTVFLRKQIDDLNKDPLRALAWKARTFLLIVSSIFAIPIVIVVRLLRPFVLIRFGRLVSGRIGHYAVNTEMYLCERELGLSGEKGIDIFFNDMFNVCNRQLSRMWGRVIPVSPFAQLCYIANNWIPGGQVHLVSWRHRQPTDLYGVLARTKPKLSFIDKEERIGTRMLEEIGIPKGSSFVCFHIRDSAYLNSVAPSRDWSYHNYRDCSIQNFIPAVEELVRRGHYVVRMGAKVKEPLNIKNPKIIDYAVKYRTDFLDIFLAAKCTFFIGCGAGIDGVARIFRRPIAYPNNIPLEYMPMWSSKDLTIPKKLFYRKENRFLTFKEVFDLGASNYLRAEQYDKVGAVPVENTSEEIAALVIEMDERLKGTWASTENDEELQRQFWAIYKPIEPYKVIRSRIGAEFLRQNLDLLSADKNICKGVYSNAGIQ